MVITTMDYSCGATTESAARLPFDLGRAYRGEAVRLADLRQASFRYACYDPATRRPAGSHPEAYGTVPVPPARPSDPRAHGSQEPGDGT
jgi:hypothetical protein